MINCTTHHHACACREAKFTEMKRELKQFFAELEADCFWWRHVVYPGTVADDKLVAWWGQVGAVRRLWQKYQECTGG